MVHTLAAMARALGWWTTVVDDGGEDGNWTEPDRVVTTLDLEAAGVGARTALVIATQGHYDEAALERALSGPAGWIGVVASHRRTALLLASLRGRGLPDEALDRLRAPAGLDLGHISHEEIAVAILAELVQFRAAGRLQVPAAVHEADQQEKGAWRSISRTSSQFLRPLTRSGRSSSTHVGWRPVCPGAELTEVVSDTQYKGKVHIKMGPVSLVVQRRRRHHRTRRRRQADWS